MCKLSTGETDPGLYTRFIGSRRNVISQDVAKTLISIGFGCQLVHEVRVPLQGPGPQTEKSLLTPALHQSLASSYLPNVLNHFLPCSFSHTSSQDWASYNAHVRFMLLLLSSYWHSQHETRNCFTRYRSVSQTFPQLGLHSPLVVVSRDIRL